MMDIKTKFNIRDMIKFHPFGDKKLKPIEAIVVGMEIKIDRTSKPNIQYVAIPEDKEPWYVREKSVIGVRRPKPRGTTNE